uniref:Uncharacterized protein n=1 Tax=Panagrolaimus sp. JU765 TaxID=591449 RepID=A0AC34R545_9BILA
MFLRTCLIFLSARLERMSTLTREVAEKLYDLDDEPLEKELESKPLEFFKDAKDVLPEPVAEKFYNAGFKKRWTASEESAKNVETRMGKMNLPDRSVAEDRFEILAELLDKICQAYEIFDEHEHRKIPFSHRLVLESRLMMAVRDGLDLITATLDDWNKIGEDRDAASIERQELRYEIRYRDMIYTEVHERFLKSYLEMDW